ncbi:SIR2 family protein [Synechococcus sp. ROS8604]|uniref:SIR2 family protein n=1 Tax=Synechococcus sp. ROS8604 TaxID=1442557 RepID=UPI001644AA7F
MLEKDGATSVLHAHGSIDNPDSITILPSDYEDFSIKHRNSIAKLLIDFIENLCLLLSYSLSDPQIKQFLVDLAEATN